MRKIKIQKVNATTSQPGSIEIAGNFVDLFQGKYYRNSFGSILPFYTANPPNTYQSIVATTFEIVGNSKYNGKYTVYTPKNDSESSSTFANNTTKIKVNEVISAINDPADPLLSDGYITNISAYLLDLGTRGLVVPPGVNITDYGVEFMGRNTTGWGEGYAQNYVNIARNFSSVDAPQNPFLGQAWYSLTDNQMRNWNGTSWVILNKDSFGITYKHAQTEANTSWVVNHNLDLDEPYIAFTQFFVDRGNGPKLIIPSDVSYTSQNQLIVEFTKPEKGYVLVRP
jgi:hypothetical protein